MTVSVYFLHGEKVSPGHRLATGPATAGAVMRQLLAGPNTVEAAAGRTSTIPAGTALLDLDIEGGLATVDLSGRFASGGGTLSMRARLAQVLFTLTRFQDVHSVAFRLDGRPATVLGGEGIVVDHPLTRAQFEDLAPAVLIEAPAVGGRADGVLRVEGSANTFEAVFGLTVTDSAGRVLVVQRVMASSGTGTRGTFDVTLRYSAPTGGSGTLTAFHYSAKDGRRVVVDTVPVVFSG
ncbi:Gmad2 immunoglobulin-like domain-containing protein [Yinghuangia soli]|uniref:GerMN domain-containing protein n=1 Tax=Yinghuangia soli TaxID=2908204 RepID=A0AA41QAC5_9ACTN|nr:Gmad2 immunoglobulin-like domain-containing protein [Yinghuangia soli]MCF2533825.1 GerMN domain-containing protein [Yinghuangia soli]